MIVNLRPINRVSNISQPAFANVILSDRPLITAEATHGWYACGGRMSDYLAQKLSPQRTRIKTSATHIHLGRCEQPRTPGSGPRLSRVLSHFGARVARQAPTGDGRITVGDYLKLWATSTEALRYMTGSQERSIFYNGKWNESFAASRSDCGVPTYVAQSRRPLCGLWIRSKGCGSHLHYNSECMRNLSAQLMGRKHVQLYFPAFAAKVYPCLYTNGHLANLAQVDVEDADHQRFPLFSEWEGYGGTLDAGDQLSIPAFWYHSSHHTGDFNVHFWWRAEFVRLTPISARDYGALFVKASSGSRIRQRRLHSWLRRIKLDMVQSR